jgi:hypothetical protein
VTSGKRVPPVRLIRIIDRVRAALAGLHRSSVPGNVALMEMSLAPWAFQALHVGARLGVADQLADGPRHAIEIAPAVGADPDALHRLMRALASRGVLKQRRDGRFGLTAVGQALRADTQGSLRDVVLYVGDPKRWHEWSQLSYSVRTGEPASEMLYGMPMFDYLQTDPEYAALFNDAMTAMSGLSSELSLQDYDFTGVRLVVDVGGGHGKVLSAILRHAPDARGVLFDLPSVACEAGATFIEAGVADRVTVQGGSFLESVPPGADLYVMKHIIHDWDDETSLTILRNIRTGIARDGTLLLLEMVLPERASSHLGHVIDLEMLLMLNGQERTRSQYAKLLSHSGFELTRVIPTASPFAIVEARPV